MEGTRLVFRLHLVDYSGGKAQQGMPSLQGVLVAKVGPEFVLHLQRNLAPVVAVVDGELLEQVLAPAGPAHLHVGKVLLAASHHAERVPDDPRSLFQRRCRGAMHLLGFFEGGRRVL